MTALEAQLAEFASLGEPSACGPLERIGRLTKLLRLLKLVTRIVIVERDVTAYAATAVWPYRRLSRLADVHVSTMQN